MLFKSRFLPAIENGSVTTTVRAWQRSQVIAGRRYSFGGTGQIEIISVRVITLSAVAGEQARTSGFSSRNELAREVMKTSPQPLRESSRVFLISFRYVAPTAPTSLAPEAVLARLREMDRRSRRGPWTRDALKSIDAAPGTPAAELAKRARREKLAFKADVRKLKALGLTKSLTVGYELTALGRRVLRMLKTR